MATKKNKNRQKPKNRKKKTSAFDRYKGRIRQKFKEANLASKGFDFPSNDELDYAFKENVSPTEVIELIQQPDED